MTWPVSVPTRALALRGAEILVIPAAPTNAGCGET
jgi:predicted amidohydrolase